MKKIEVSFRWSDLDNESKRNLIGKFEELLGGPARSFESLDRGLTTIECEFVMCLQKGIPHFRLSDRTRGVIFSQMFN